MSSSFGIETAVLLDMVARSTAPRRWSFWKPYVVSRNPGLQDLLQDRLRLTDIRVVTPDSKIVARYDPNGALHETIRSCCHIRKVLPLRHAMKGFDAWITGRKRFHGGGHETLPVIDCDGDHIKINPLATGIAIAFARRSTIADCRAIPWRSRAIPRSDAPLARPCPTIRDPRSGRWRYTRKTECGIHKAPWFGSDISLFSRPKSCNLRRFDNRRTLFLSLMRVDAFDFHLPENAIAQVPASPRDAARLLHVSSESINDLMVRDLSGLLRPGDVMVFNDTRVVPARLTGIRSPSPEQRRAGSRGARVELTLHKRDGPDSWRAFAKPARKLKTGDMVAVSDEFLAEVRGKGEDGGSPFGSTNPFRPGGVAATPRRRARPI